MADYYFKTRRLSVGYGKVPLLEEITVGVDRGEIMVLIGPNGAGKSTVLKSIAGQLQPLSGCIYLDQKDTAKLGRSKLAEQMAVVFTDKIQAEMLTCEDVVAGGRYPYTGRFGVLSKSDLEVVEKSMEMTLVSEIRNQDYNKVSDGQRQRVLLARALCQEPDIILLDEPTSYLDIRYQLEFLSTLQRLAKEKKLSVIMSLHELVLAQRIADKILCVGSGGVDRVGTPEEVFTDGYIGKLFGIEKGRYEEADGDVELEAPKGEAKLFVLAGCGSGREIYRRLQREGTAFATGILYEHDVDYPVARALAATVVSVQGTEPIGAEQMMRARKLIDACDRVILCRERFGEWEYGNAELFQYARASGKV